MMDLGNVVILSLIWVIIEFVLLCLVSYGVRLFFMSFLSLWGMLGKRKIVEFLMVRWILGVVL